MIVPYKKLSNSFGKNSEKLKKYLIPFVLLIIVWIAFKNVFKGAYNYVITWYKSQGSNMTDEQAQNIAETLKEAFANWIPYNSFDTVKDELGSVSLVDYYKIKNAFGLVARDFSGAPATDITSALYTDKNLGQWLKLELSASQQVKLKEINIIFVDIL